MFGFSLSEILFLSALALIVIGPKQLPEVARTVGRFLNELKRTTNGMTYELRNQMRIDDLDLKKAALRSEPPVKSEQKIKVAESNSEPVQQDLFAQTPTVHPEFTDKKDPS